MALDQLNIKQLIVTFIITLTMSTTLNGQNLKEHQWKNRVVLIITNDLESQLYRSQLSAFSSNSEALKERKLLVYKLLPETYRIENGEENAWINDSELYSKYNPNNKSFQIILIGFDGGVKLQQDTFLTTSRLFSAIDAMPMRRAELRDNK